MTSGATEWNHIVLASHVPPACRPAVEALFFFNPRQAPLAQAIRSAIERAGMPEIREADGRVWLATPRAQSQCLFALDSRLAHQPPAGVVLYCRPSLDLIWIIHLAVAANYGNSERDLDSGLGAHLISTVAGIARSIRGVERIQLPYVSDSFVPLRERC